MTLLPEIREQLCAAAMSRSQYSRARLPRGGRWRIPAAGVLVTAVSTLVVVGVVAFVLLNVHGQAGSGTPPVSGGAGSTPPPAAWGRALGAARDQTASRDSACRSQLSYVPRPQRLLQAAPGRNLTSILGVLRRPAPAEQMVSQQVLRGLRIDAQDIYIRYARHGVTDGVSWYLVPAASVGDLKPLPVRCYREQLTAFRRLVAGLPATERTGAIQFEQHSLEKERSLAHAPAGVCLINAIDGTPGDCRSTAQLRKHPWTAGSSGSNDLTVTALIVPDQAATVTAHYPAGHRGGRVTHQFTISRPNIDNVVIFRLIGGWDPPSLTYRSASGAVLWSSARSQIVNELQP